MRQLRPKHRSRVLHNFVLVKNLSIRPKIFDEGISSEERISQHVKHSVKEFYKKQGQFRPSFISSHEHLVSEKAPHTITLPLLPPTDFQNIIKASKYNVPQMGSFVEFQSENQMKVGVVVQDLQARFDERLNHVLVLTNDNKIVTVKPLSVKFHLYKVIPDGFIDYQEILHERHNLSQPDRQRGVALVNRFLVDTAHCKERLSSPMDEVFSQLTQGKIRSISLLDIVDCVEFRESEVVRTTSSIYHQFVLLYAIHANLVDSCQWVVPNYFGDTPSNVFLWEHSSNYHSSAQYFVNTQDTWLHIYRFRQRMSNNEDIADINAFLQKLKSVSKEEMNAYLNVFEGRHFIDVLMAMKFAIIYPHSSLIAELVKLDVFDTTPTPSDIHRLLVDLKVYDDTTTISDIYLSLGLFGSSKSLSVTQVDQLNSKAPASFNVRDNFKHLRSGRSYYNDHVIYGLVDEGEDMASFGISIESLNSRKHLINIHIPDFITHISPDSKTFKSIFQFGTIAESLIHLCNGESWNCLYPEKVVLDRKFHNYSNYNESEEIWGDVIDMEQRSGKKRRAISKSTCLTISFEFNSYESNPFEDLDGKVSVSFDSISNVNIKNVNKKVLQECLTGELEPSFFKLLRRKHHQEPDIACQENSLNKTDIHNINYIGGVLKTFQKVRGLEGAAISLKGYLGFANLRTKQYESGNGLKTEIIKSESPSRTPQADFMHREAKIFADSLASVFSFQNQIPLLIRSQELDSNDFEKDSVLVQHDNIMMPVYESHEYSHSIMAKDESDSISLNAKFISHNYLAPKYSTTNHERNVPLGLSMGYAKVFDIFHSGEALFNQFQLLSFVQNDYQRAVLRKSEYLEFVEKFSHLKSLGYNLNGPFPERKLNLLINLANSNDLKTIWLYRMHKFWVLTWLNQKRAEKDLPEESRFECITTHVEQFGSNKVCKAYCSELGIEVDALCLVDQDIKVGTTLVCDEILYLDPIGGFCMLDGRGDIRI